MSKVGQMLTGIDELAVVEYNVEISLPKVTMGRVAAEVEQVLASDETPFDDPRFERQWHLQNNGTDWKNASGDPYIKGAVKGADVNVVPAWEKCTGSDKVIVSVVDGVVDHDHEDLAGNIWYNEAEKNGTDGVDDDDNGYVDDVYGFHFYSNKGFSGMKNPTPGSGSNHGTHCAGVIAAMNNNGKGVSGIAGGTDTKGGVLIMSCATMSDDKGQGRGADVAAKAITYGCNNGAVISQNSWGFTNSNINWNSDQFSSLREAIKYFTDYAGMDETGEVQVGPMKGGMVIFAASNEGYYEGDIKKYPAADENVVAVASIAADYRPAYYTNYGAGCNIAAPGGDGMLNRTTRKSEILSTVISDPAEGVGNYAYQGGTSMACPIVSGIAALGLSYAKELGKTFTREEFTSLLLSSVNNIDSRLAYGYKDMLVNNALVSTPFSAYQYNMGTGIIDAWKFMMNIEGTPCLSVKMGSEKSYSLDAYFGSGSEYLTYTEVEMDRESMVSLGITMKPEVKFGRLVVNPGKAGSGKIKITAIAGGNNVAGNIQGDMTGNGDIITIPNSNGGIGGMYITREISLVSRGVANDNGGWL